MRRDSLLNPVRSFKPTGYIRTCDPWMSPIPQEKISGNAREESDNQHSAEDQRKRSSRCDFIVVVVRLRVHVTGWLFFFLGCAFCPTDGAKSSVHPMKPGPSAAARLLAVVEDLERAHATFQRAESEDSASVIPNWWVHQRSSEERRKRRRANSLPPSENLYWVQGHQDNHHICCCKKKRKFCHLNYYIVSECIQRRPDNKSLEIL